MSVYARVERTIVDGETFFDRTTDEANRAVKAAERSELEKAEPNMAPAPRGGPGGPPAQRSMPPTGGNR